MSKPIRVVERREQSVEIIQWDGSQEAADWMTERFGGQVEVGGSAPNLTLTIWGTWVLEPGWWVADRWGSPNPTEAAQVNQQFAMPLPDIDIPVLTEEPTAPSQEEPVENVPDEAQEPQP